jgi:Transposase IS4
MGIYCMGITRKKAEGFPLWLQNHIDNNNELLWDSTLAEVIDENTLCFIWQDNKTVGAISTAHSLYRSEDKIQRKRRCPKITSENRRILQPVFNGQPFKELFIPRAINDYNHHMKGVDQANQLRASFTCHRKQNYRTWWPLISFFIDIAGVNSYLLWKWSSSINAANATRTHNSHRSFLNALYKQLLHSNDKERHKKQQATEEPKNERSQYAPTTELDSDHRHIQKEFYGRCEWGKTHPPGCSRKRSPKKRKFGTDITESTVNDVSNNISGGSKTHYECSRCQIWLCIEGSCWQQYHNSIKARY